MGNRKNKPTSIRVLSSFASFIILGSLIYIMVAGINLFSGSLLTAGVLAVIVPAAVAGEGFVEIVLGVFETFFDGLMEVFSGVLDAISSLFG